MRLEPGDGGVEAAQQTSADTGFVEVTVKLGSSLRSRAPEWEGGEGALNLDAVQGATVRDVLGGLGLTPDDVNLIYRNHRLVSADARVEGGDRVALFPPNFIHFSHFYAKREDAGNEKDDANQEDA